MQARDITGQIFGRWTALSKVVGTGRWLCVCTCGVQKEVLQSNLTTGKTTSCGCLKKELQTKHGDAGTPLYQAWADIKQRCTNPKSTNYKHYGARGITYSSEWETYLPFKEWAESEGYQEGLEIDRINNEGDYVPNNCRWTTRNLNLRNKRKDLNTSSKYRGVYWSNHANKWIAQLARHRSTKRIGSFNDEIEAAKARDNFITTNNLQGYILNFE